MKPNPSSQNQLPGEKGRLSLNPPIQFGTTTPPFLLVLALACFAFLPNAQAVNPPPDGGYPGFNTAEGQNALFSLDTSTGLANTAVGWFSLKSSVDASFNTGVGAGTLVLNSGDQNTAIGAAALLLNTTGFGNTAVGSTALLNNTGGNSNTATGTSALQSNTIGFSNTANGASALFSNTTGSHNTATGVAALYHNTTGNGNVALGTAAGFNATTGNSNVYIGPNMQGVAGESNTCYIASIFGQTSVDGVPILINSNNKLGTATSSKRFKEDIKAMDKASEALLALKPVTFHYKKEIDQAGRSQFGLVAEELEQVNPDLVVRDEKGEIYSVRYEAVNAMLLNEFLKEHKAFLEEQRKVQELKKDFQVTVAQQQKEIRVLAARLNEQVSQLQKVSAQLELSGLAPRTVLNDR